MDDDEKAPRKEYPLSPARMSKTPSWIMLGFGIGALFVLALDRKGPVVVEAPRRVEAPKKTAPPTPRPLTVIEAVFESWGRYAVWSDDTTEVALWNSDDRAFSDFYEVRRVDGVNYFRTLTRLSRRMMTHREALPDSPLQFTETEEQYRDWRDSGRSEPAWTTPLERPAAAPPPAIRLTPPRPSEFQRMMPPLETPASRGADPPQK